LLSSAAASYQLRFGQDKLCWAFVCYLLLLYLYSSAVGGRHSNEFPACSNTRPLPATLCGQLRVQNFSTPTHLFREQFPFA